MEYLNNLFGILPSFSEVQRFDTSSQINYNHNECKSIVPNRRMSRRDSLVRHEAGCDVKLMESQGQDIAAKRRQCQSPSPSRPSQVTRPCPITPQSKTSLQAAQTPTGDLVAVYLDDPQTAQFLNCKYFKDAFLVI